MRLSASSTAASRGRAGSARASTICPAKIGKASSAAAISTRPAAMASARRHCRRHRLGDEPNGPEERIFSSLGFCEKSLFDASPTKGRWLLKGSFEPTPG